MKEKRLIIGNTFVYKIKRNIINFINKLKRKTKNEIKNDREEQINKKEIMELYNKYKKKEISLQSIDIKKLKILLRLAEEELSIMKNKCNQEITQQYIIDREIKYYEQRLEKLTHFT